MNDHREGVKTILRLLRYAQSEAHRLSLMEAAQLIELPILSVLEREPWALNLASGRGNGDGPEGESDPGPPKAQE